MCPDFAGVAALQLRLPFHHALDARIPPASRNIRDRARIVVIRRSPPSIRESYPPTHSELRPETEKASTREAAARFRTRAGTPRATGSVRFAPASFPHNTAGVLPRCPFLHSPTGCADRCPLPSQSRKRGRIRVLSYYAA